MAFLFVHGWNVKPCGYQQIASATLAAATGLTAPTPPRVTVAMIQAEGGNLRWRDDGTDPDANTGMLLLEGDTLPYMGDLAAIKLIRVAAGALANVAYYRAGEGGE